MMARLRVLTLLPHSPFLPRCNPTLPPTLPTAQLAGGLHATRAAVADLAVRVSALALTLEQSEAVRSISPPAPPVPTPGSAAATAGADAGGTVDAGSSTGTSSGSSSNSNSLRGLPACHVRRMVAAAGPLLAARVVAHSAVAGDEQPLMWLHAALSRVFGGGSSSSGSAAGGGSSGGGSSSTDIGSGSGSSSSSRVNPLARQVTYPTTTPVCLPLCLPPPSPTVSSSTSASTSTSVPSSPPLPPVTSPATPFLELELLQPAAVAAVSFRYPPYGSWDTRTALLELSVTLYEEVAEEASGEAPGQRGTAGVAGTGSSSSSGIRSNSSSSRVALRARVVELPPLRGLECQYLSLPPPPPPPPTAAPAAAAAAAAVRPRVHAVRVHVLRNFGGVGLACVPRVLLHGVAAAGEDY